MHASMHVSRACDRLHADSVRVDAGACVGGGGGWA